MLHYPLSDFLKNTFKIPLDIFIGKSQESNALLLQFPLRPFIFFPTTFV